MGKRNRRREARGEPVKPAMTTDEIKAAGLSVDLPYEAPTSDDLRYADGRTLTEAYPDLLEPNWGRLEGGDDDADRDRG